KSELVRSRRDAHRRYRGNPLHNFVPPEKIDDRIACLHGVQNAIRLRPVKQRSQFHEMMAGAPRVETVNGNGVFLSALQRAAIWKRHSGNPAIGTATLRVYRDPQQTSWLMAGIHFFHQAFYLIRGEHGRTDEV